MGLEPMTSRATTRSRGATFRYMAYGSAKRSIADPGMNPRMKPCRTSRRLSGGRSGYEISSTDSMYRTTLRNVLRRRLERTITMLLANGVPTHVAEELADHADINTATGSIRVWDDE